MHNSFLKKYYFIDKFDPNHLIKLDKNIILIYRNYTSKTDEKVIISIKEFCKKNRRKFYISNDLKTALKYNLDGLYLPSFNNQIIPKSCFERRNFKIIGSAHNIKEINQKNLQGVSEVFLASLFKEKETYLGLYKFKKLSNVAKTKVVALGGINIKNIRILKLIDICGFAGISFFQKKTAPKKGPLN